MGLGYLFGDLMCVGGMCGISDFWGVDNVWGLMVYCGLRSQGPDTFNKGI